MTIAAWNGHNDIVKLLLQRGGDSSIRQSNGDVPLTLAASKGQMAVCRTLLEAGADPNVEQNNKDTCVPRFSSIPSSLLPSNHAHSCALWLRPPASPGL